MNNETRADLVEELEEELRNAYGLGLDSKRYSPLLGVQPFVEKIDRLLADRAMVTVAEPDAEAVERVAKAMEHYWCSAIQTEEGWSFSGMAEAATKAASRAAITAVPSSADANWLDAALDSVQAELNWTEKRTVGYESSIRILTGPDAANDEDYAEITGTGPTRRAAILDAVANAKGA